MGYFDSLAESAFKKNPDGEGWLYYPNGMLSKGRVVLDEEYKEKLFKFQKRIFMFLLPLGILYGFGLGVDDFELSSLVPPVVILILVYFRQYILIRNLPKSDVKLKYKEATGKAAQGLPNWYFYSMYVLSASLIIMALFSPQIFNKPYSEVTDLMLMFLGMGVVGLLLALFLHKIKKSNATNK